MVEGDDAKRKQLGLCTDIALRSRLALRPKLTTAGRCGPDTERISPPFDLDHGLDADSPFISGDAVRTELVREHVL